MKLNKSDVYPTLYQSNRIFNIRTIFNKAQKGDVYPTFYQRSQADVPEIKQQFFYIIERRSVIACLAYSQASSSSA